MSVRLCSHEPGSRLDGPLLTLATIPATAMAQPFGLGARNQEMRSRVSIGNGPG